jgi:hypothetical protein
MPEPGLRSRRGFLDLLTPDTVDIREIWSAAVTIDARAQLQEMVTLFERGLMSIEEFERQRRKIATTHY